GQLTITESMTIVGAGPSETIIDGDGPSTHQRVIYISTTNTPVTIAGVTIRNGHQTYTGAPTNDPNAFAGGILHNSDLTLRNVVVSGNSALASTGGAYGGGIYSSAKLTLIDSRVTGNSVNVTTSGIASGGGIVGNSTVIDSTIDGNTARDYGGGIY